MADPTLRERADQRFEQALQATGARDPRDFYRTRLRELREQDAAAFKRALEYFDGTLTPEVAREGSDPIAAWLEYGRFLATLVSPGRTVQVDPSGLAHAYTPPVPQDHLVLHLPERTAVPVQVVGLPTQLSPAQRATYDLLVKGAQAP